MRNILALTSREVNSIFLSALAYLLLAVFMLFSGIFFYLNMVASRQASMENTVGMTLFFFLVGTPLLTMRLMSEEYRTGTIETLMTAPVTDGQVILGKFFGALAFYVFMLLPTLIYVLILALLGKPDGGVILSSYVGLFLMGCQFIALGLFCSALTRHQIISGVLALVMLLVIWVAGFIGEYLLTGGLKPIVEYIGAQQHVRPFSAGRIAFRNIFYFVSLTCFWLFLSVRVLESKRWR